MPCGYKFFKSGATLLSEIIIPYKIYSCINFAHVHKLITSNVWLIE
jgi:hypothetical protein